MPTGTRTVSPDKPVPASLAVETLDDFRHVRTAVIHGLSVSQAIRAATMETLLDM